MPQRKASVPQTPQQEAHKKRFAAIAKRVTELRQTYKRKTRKQLWKIASEAYDAANQL